MNSFSSLRQQKQELRRLMETKRQDETARNPQAALALRDLILKNISFPAGNIIASYYARGSEINPMPLTDSLRERGHIIALPVMDGRRAPLLFRQHAPDGELALGHFGVYEPLPAAPLVEPDILLVPLLAFDRTRGRLGYGGGYYDRTLAHLRQRKNITAIGIGFACQEVVEIPMGSFDVRLDKVATEQQIF